MIGRLRGGGIFPDDISSTGLSHMTHHKKDNRSSVDGFDYYEADDFSFPEGRRSGIAS